MALYSCHAQVCDRRKLQHRVRTLSISPEVVLGNNVKVQNNVSIYTGCDLRG
jgi:hypothetical protein